MQGGTPTTQAELPCSLSSEGQEGDPKAQAGEDGGTLALKS